MEAVPEPEVRQLILLHQQGSQSSSDHLVERLERAWTGLLEVPEPADQPLVQVRDHAREAVTPVATRLCPDALFQLVQTLLAHEPQAGFEPIAEELEPFPRLPAITDMRLLGMQRKTAFAYPYTNNIEGGFGLLARPAQDHEVVRVPHHAVSTLGDQCIQRVEIDVGQQRTHHGTLWRTQPRRPSLQPLEDIGRQPTADQIENSAIADLLLDTCHKLIVRNRIEVRLQVGIHHVGVAVLDQPIDFAQRVMAPASRSEAVASIAEPVFEDRFDH